MEITELINWMTEGLPEDQAKIVKATIERDSVKTKVATLKQQSEIEAIQNKAAKVAELEQQLDAVDEQGNPRGYRSWYNKHFAAVEKMNKDVLAFEAKYGQGSFAKAVTGEFTPAATGGPGLTEADIKRMAAEATDTRIRDQYSPQWSNLLTNTGKIVQKHMYAGRKKPIDFDELGKIATTKFNGNLEAAYDEWDAPEREKVAKEERESEIKRRVDEELQKRGASQHFSPGADLTPSSLSARPKAQVEGFDKTALMNQMAQDWASGLETKQ